MAKSTRHGGASQTPEERGEHIKIRRPMLGEVDRPSVGNSSETRSGKERKTKSNVTQNPPSPVPTTESPLPVPEPETDSTADSTATDGQSKTQQPSGKKAAPAKKTTGRPSARVVDEFD